ncbi:MAG: SCO family protein [Planctomycetes bacterium]|nr:SCO family protein [Planctomycetota bacterium]
MIRRHCLRSWTPVLLLLFVGAPTFGTPGSVGRKGGDRWGANYFPNVPLITHEGKTVRFFDDLIKDKVVVINFIYTTCPDVCPLETAKLAQLQAILGDRVGRDIFIYSITIDPENDTPEVLAEYAKVYQAGPGWLFLTGKEADITLLRVKLGLYIDEIQDEDSNDHNVSLLIGNQRTGRWMKRSPFENSHFLATQIGSWLHNWKIPDTNQDSYAHAPKLRKMSSGENLFRTRCSACHVIGGADQVPAYQNARLLGPDLLNVTKRRDRAWLSRWLAEPDKMLAEKDPLALELQAKHGQVAMPNMGLNEVDVAALLEYFEVESLRVEKVQKYTDARVASQKSSGARLPCCQKSKNAVLKKSETLAQTVSLGEGAESQRSGMFLGLTGQSAGLGCFFLLLAAIFRRRSSTAVDG